MAAALAPELRARLLAGTVIPAHPLALTAERGLDERRQRALSRYYLDAGAGGLAVGVHTTQFLTHDPSVGLLAPVLELAREQARAFAADGGDEAILVAGAIGPTTQAVREAELAASLGYHAVLLRPELDLTADEQLARARAVGEVLPLVGFYLQDAVGGRPLGRDFWAEFASIDAVIAIKAAPFDRYRSIDVLHGVVASGRADEIAMYTGNDDHIIADLLTTHRVPTADGPVEIGFVGGLLGQWSMWTRRAVEQLQAVRAARSSGGAAVSELLTVDGQLTSANSAIFDSANGFRGCNPGIAEVLHRHGLMAGRWCLDPAEDLSPGQLAELDRVWALFPHLRDDEFIAGNLDRWLS